jgi:hypothetical protein
METDKWFREAWNICFHGSAQYQQREGLWYVTAAMFVLMLALRSRPTQFVSVGVSNGGSILSHAYADLTKEAEDDLPSQLNSEYISHWY